MTRGARASLATDLNRLSEGGNGFSCWDEFLPEIALETCLADCRYDGGVVELLVFIDLVPSWVASSVVVRDVLMVLLDGADDITFHDLHVIDVIEELEVRGGKGFAELGSPAGVVTLVVGVIDFGVQELHDEDDPMFFGKRNERLESPRTVLEPSGVVESVSITREADYLWDFCLGGSRDELLIDCVESGVVLDAVESSLDAAESRGMLWGSGYGAAHSELGDFTRLRRVKEVDAGIAQGKDFFGEIGKGDLSEGPVGDGVFHGMMRAKARSLGKRNCERHCVNCAIAARLAERVASSLMMKRNFDKKAALRLGFIGWFFSYALVNGQEGDARAQAVAKRVMPPLQRALQEKGLKFGSPVFVRIFKEERLLELWMKQVDSSDSFQLFRTYPIAAMSGSLGPKLAEGDRQAPEGFYHVPASMMNPRSRFHLAFNIGYPNRYDQAHGRTGSFIMVHGDRQSIGCFAMTDAKIEEIYTLCDAALKGGQSFFRVHSFPFRMTSERMERTRDHRWESFWKNLQEGYQWFEEKKNPPRVEVASLKYIFRAKDP